MATELNLTHDDIYKDVRTFLLSVFQLAPENVIRGYSNNVPLPNGDFILMNIIHEQRASTNVHEYDIILNKATVHKSSNISMQLDFYGEKAGVMASELVILWRDYYACENLTKCQPLYCDEPKFMPFTNEKSEYEERWMVTANLNYTPAVTHDQDFITNPQIQIIKL